MTVSRATLTKKVKKVMKRAKTNKEKVAAVKDPIVCEVCNGFGRVSPTESCEACKGTGKTL